MALRLVWALATWVALCAAQEGGPLDLIIAGGRVMDGTGNPWVIADVGIREGKIAAIGRLEGARARRVIDARGKLVAPGFIDLHSHADDGLGSDDARRRAAPNLVTQGITTVVVNPDGFGPWPLSAQREKLERAGVGPNVALMAGHNTIRRRTLGENYRREAGADEIARMKQLVREGMEAGAFGLSAGLEYVPGIWSTTEELIALVEEIVPFGGVYIAHQRSESTEPRWYLASRHPKGLPTLLDATRETIEIAEKTGARVVCTHLKAMGAHYWGTTGAAIRLIERARSRGLDVWADQYPYHSTGGDGSMVLIPGWAAGVDPLAGDARPGAKDYAAALRKTMEDPEQAAGIRRDIAHEMSRRGGPENIVVFDHPDKSFVGRSLDHLAAARGIGPVEMALQLQYEGYRDRLGGARLRGFSVWEQDLKALMAQPWMATSTDAGIALPEDGPVHARFYGSYPRKLRRYALDDNVIRLEDAIRSSTSLPAQILGLRGRGLLRAGFWADLVVIDLAKVEDKATFTDPHQYSEGIELVLVNGQPVVEGGRPAGALAGKVLQLTPPAARSARR
jgi:N-acyl-D-amino-acid deacylase